MIIAAGEVALFGWWGFAALVLVSLALRLWRRRR
jgi:hypothetical protein